MNTVLKIILYPIFGLIAFVTFFLLFFPYGSLKDKITAEINKGLGGQYEIMIGDFYTTPLSKLHFKDVTIKSKGLGGAVELIGFDKIDAELALLPLVTGDFQVKFSAKQ